MHIKKSLLILIISIIEYRANVNVWHVEDPMLNNKGVDERDFIYVLYNSVPYLLCSGIISCASHIYRWSYPEKKG